MVDAMRPLSCNGKIIPQIPYVVQHLSRFLPILASSLKPYGKAKPEDVLVWAGVTVPRQYRHALKPLIWAAGRNPHQNRYHHDWHNMTVMVFAAILAGLLPRHRRLSADDQFTLVLAAMVHDLDHRGRGMVAKNFAEETRSAMIASRRLFGNKGGQGQAWRRLVSMIKHTSFDITSVDQKTHPLSALLKDADLLGSVVFPHPLVHAMTLGLKHEQKIKMPSAQILSQFIENLAKRGLSSKEGQHVLTCANSASAFQQYPRYAKDLISNSVSGQNRVRRSS